MSLFDASETAATPGIEIVRIAWAGPLTILTSLVAVHAVREIAIRIPGVHADCIAFRRIAVTADTLLLCTIGVLIFGLISAFHDDAIHRFRWIAFGALLVSFLPLLANPQIANLATALGVASMHVGAYIPCVTLLPFATASKGH